MANINIRIDNQLKEESKEILEELGLDLTTGIRTFLRQVVIKRGLPYDLNLSELDMSILQIEQGQGTRVSNVKDLMSELDED